MAKTLQIDLPEALAERLRTLVEAGELADEELGAKLDGLFGPPGAESLEKRLRKDRPMTTLSLRLPEDVLDDLERVAARNGFSGHLPLIRAYIGQGLRRDLEALQQAQSSGRPNRRRQPTHPGEILREDILPELGLSVAEAARQLRVPRQTLHRILSGQSAVTPAMALRLGKFCGTGPDLWLRMQQAHDLWQASERLRVELEAIPTHLVRPVPSPPRGYGTRSHGRKPVMRDHPEGSDFDDFLREEGMLEEVEAVAVKRVLALQIAEAMKELELSKADMARRMGTSRSSLDRLLDPNTPSVTFLAIEKVASVLGKRVRIEMVDARPA